MYHWLKLYVVKFGPIVTELAHNLGQLVNSFHTAYIRALLLLVDY